MLANLKQLPASLPMPFETTSDVYRYFEHVGPSQPKNGVSRPLLRCRLCHEANKPDKMWKHFGATSVFNDHIKNHHPSQWKLIVSSNTTTQKASKSKTLDNATIKSIDSAIRKWILTDGHSFSVIERRGFRQMINTVLPGYQLKSRSTISRDVDKDFEQLYTLYKTKISNCESVSVTINLWKCKTTLDNYLGVTVHFYDSQFDEMNSCTIACEMHHADDETGEGIKQQLEKVFIDWGIKHLIRIVVADGGANLVKALELLNMDYIHCFAHRLNLIYNHFCDQTNKRNSINWDISAISNVIEKAQKVSVYFREQEPMKFLTKLQSEAGVKRPKKMKLKIENKWNTSYFMLSRILELRPYLADAYLIDKNIPTLVRLSNDDIEIMDDLIKALRPLYDATVALSGRYYPTLSMAIPVTTGLYKYIESLNVATQSEATSGDIENNQNHRNSSLSFSNASRSVSANYDASCESSAAENVCYPPNDNKTLRSPYGSVIKRSLLYQIESYLLELESNRTACIATILDPRFGKCHFRREENYENAFQWTVDELKSNHFAEAHNSIAASISSIPSSSNNKRRKHSHKPTLVNSIWEYADQMETMEQQRTDNNDLDYLEILKLYKGRPLVERQADPLKYNFPEEICKMARLFLCITATSVPSESSFSEAGNTIGKTRANLALDNVNKLLFIHSIYNSRLACTIESDKKLTFDNLDSDSDSE